MITSISIADAQKQLRTFPAPKLVLAQDAKFNRALLEHGAFDILVMNHALAKHDTLRSLDIPFNDVFARIAAKNKISLAFDFSSLRKLKECDLARELARISDSIAICRKTQTRLAILHAYTPEGARAFLRTLGASSQQATFLLVLTKEP